ncbi:MAG: pilus assembly protein [Bacilli bacterium]|nr:pilus assembly protein [Bacilli bacterium]MBR3209408.1 pilus assembly protein [Bacilli bacterium]
MNKKGQALIEFILILPVLLITIMSVADVGNIYIKKYELNGKLDTISDIYLTNKNEALAYAANENITLEETTNGNLITITAKKIIKINAPILSKIIGKTFEIKESKTLYNEQ